MGEEYKFKPEYVAVNAVLLAIYSYSYIGYTLYYTYSRGLFRFSLIGVFNFTREQLEKSQNRNSIGERKVYEEEGGGGGVHAARAPAFPRARHPFRNLEVAVRRWRIWLSTSEMNAA